MKKIAFILILLLLIPTVVIAKDVETDEMDTLTSLVMANDLAIEQWKVTLKEKITKSKLEGIIDNMRKNYLVTTTEDEDAVKYLIRDPHKTGGIDVVYSAIIPKDAKFETEFTAVIKGNEWNESTLHTYKQKINFIMKHHFTNSAKRFACLTTEDDGIIKGEHFLYETMQHLDLKYVSTQTDNVKKSTNKKIIYGYTSLWQQKITVMEKPVNIQIAIKNTENGNSKITVGTPILINEY